VEEIVSSLREMGIPEEDARRLIVLANREILLTLRNDLREIVRGVLDEEKDHLVADLRKEVRDYLEAQSKLMNRNLLKFLRDEVNKYISELTRLEEKVDVIDRRVLDLEKEVFKRETGSIRFGRGFRLGPFFLLFGGIFLALAALAPLDNAAKIALGVVGFILVIGGFMLG